MVALVMGVTGVGKTTVGRRLADRLGWRFMDADDFHSPENKARMHRGEALTDDLRAPWIHAIADALRDARERGQDVVLACSALRHEHRMILAEAAGEMRILLLQAPAPEVAARLRHRHGHFAGTDLLPSQYRALQPPGADEDVTVLQATEPLETIVDAAERAIRQG